MWLEDLAVARDNRHLTPRTQRQDWSDADGHSDAQNTTTYYLVPPSRDGHQTPVPAASLAKQAPQRHDNLVELRDSAPKDNQTFAALPGLAKTRGFGTLASFVLFVVLPTIFAFIYYSSIASPQYASEFRFSVKDKSAAPAPSAPPIMSALGGGPSSSSVENYLVVDYLTSRQVVEDLQKQLPLIELYSRPNINSWSRFDASLPIEEFVTYWRKMITAHYDQVTGIAAAQVRAFSPKDSLAIANALVTLSENLVNSISNRTRMDSVRFAEEEVEKAQERVRRVRAQLVERTSGNSPGGSPLAGANAALLLDLERQTSQNMLASAMQSLDQARANAVSQHLYITPYVRPSLPQSAAYPRIFLETLLTAALAFMFWVIALLSLRAIFDR